MAEEKKNRFEISNRLYAFGIILLLGLIVSWSAKIYADIKNLPENLREVSISGQGSVFAKPDVAILKVGIVTQGSKVQDVVEENTQKMDAVQSEIKMLGVAEKDIETVTYDLVSSDQGYCGDTIEEKEIQKKSYTLTNEIKLKIRDFSKIASIVAKATDKGANELSSLQYSIENPEKAKADATKKAMEAARAKANFMARQSGLKFMKLVNIYEDPYEGYGHGCGGDGSLLQAGQQEITSNVQLSYRVK